MLSRTIFADNGQRRRYAILVDHYTNSPPSLLRDDRIAAVSRRVCALSDENLVAAHLLDAGRVLLALTSRVRQQDKKFRHEVERSAVSRLVKTIHMQTWVTDVIAPQHGVVPSRVQPPSRTTLSTSDPEAFVVCAAGVAQSTIFVPTSDNAFFTKNRAVAAELAVVQTVLAGLLAQLAELHNFWSSEQRALEPVWRHIRRSQLFLSSRQTALLAKAVEKTFLSSRQTAMLESQIFAALHHDEALSVAEIAAMLSYVAKVCRVVEERGVDVPRPGQAETAVEILELFALASCRVQQKIAQATAQDVCTVLEACAAVGARDDFLIARVVLQLPRMVEAENCNLRCLLRLRRALGMLQVRGGVLEETLPAMILERSWQRGAAVVTV